jgi:hypothetical protein
MYRKTQVVVMGRKFEDIVSVTIAISLTLLFVEQTFARWPTPLRLQNFSIERTSPFEVLHSRHTKNLLITAAKD